MGDTVITSREHLDMRGGVSYVEMRRADVVTRAFVDYAKQDVVIQSRFLDTDGDEFGAMAEVRLPFEVARKFIAPLARMVGFDTYESGE